MEIIKSKDNPFYKNLIKIMNSKVPQYALLEGPHLYEQWVASNKPIECIICSESFIEKNSKFLSFFKSEVRCVSDALFSQLSDVVSNQGLMILVKYSIGQKNDLDFTQSIVMLDGVQDPGNIGTILRTCLAVNIHQVIMNDKCANAWSSKVIRSAQGAHAFLDIYRLNLIEIIELPKIMDEYEVIATLISEEAKSLYKLNLNKKIAWIFGNEGAGISKEVCSKVDTSIMIPMESEIESLNVGVAASVCLYEQYRQKLSQ